MKKKIIIFIHQYDGFMKIYINDIIKCLLKKNYQIFLYHKNKLKIKDTNCIVQEDLEYFLKMHDPRIYEKFFLFAKKKNISRVLIPRFEFPEYLYSSIISINYNYKIYLSTMALELFSKSIGRLTILKKILLEKKVKSLVIHSALNKYTKIPKKFSINKNIQKKLFFVSEPIYHPHKKFFNKEIFRPHNFKILYFGNWFYGKGVDILIKSSKYLDKSIKIIIVGNSNTLNFSYKLDKKNKNIKIINRYVSNIEMYKIFKSVDAVVLPYRKTYMYLSSGVLVNSIQSFKPAIVPNFYPFNEIIDRYKVGVKFNPDNHKSLAKGIMSLKKLVQKKYFKEKYFNDYLEDMNYSDYMVTKLKL